MRIYRLMWRLRIQTRMLVNGTSLTTELYREVARQQSRMAAATARVGRTFDRETQRLRRAS